MNERVHTDIRLEEDRLPARTIVGVIAATVAIVVGSIFVARGLLLLWQPERPPVEPVPRPSVIAGVEQSMFEGPGRGPKLLEAQRQGLQTVGPAEPGHARIPIERAMELRARGVRP